jgi:hypothetical protein
MKATHWVITDSFILSVRKVDKKLYKTIEVFFAAKNFLELNKAKDLMGIHSYPNHVIVTQDQYRVIDYIFTELFEQLST